MKVIISAGGTGGHIYPALAIVNKIKKQEPNSQFLYIGTHNRMEKDIVPATGIPFKSIEIYGFNRKHLLKNIKTIKTMLSSYKECKSIIKEFNPDVVLGVGGYVTVPVIRAASSLGYKTFIHEQNSVPGKANKSLRKYASKIGVSFPSTMKYFPKSKTVYTGNPVSEDAVNQKPMTKEELGLNPNKRLVYIVMGSLGSSKVNNVILEAMDLFASKDYEVAFITGKDAYQNIITNNVPSNVKVYPYIENQTRAMQLADLLVSRCGASTLSEIIALKLPSILIPSPYVPDNHQYKNAIDLINNKAGHLLEEKDLSASKLVSTIDLLINNKHTLANMKYNLSKMHISNSATKIYKIIKDLVDGI